MNQIFKIMASIGIKENYVPFETAMILRKKHFFDEKCFAVYNMKGSIIHNSYFKINYPEQIWAPTYSMVRAWLRKLGIEIFVNKLNEVSKFDSNRILRAFYFFDIVNSQGVCDENWTKNIDVLKNDYPTYEEAEKAAINYVLENWDFLMAECNKLQNLKKNNKREEELIKIQEKEERNKNGE